MIIHDGPHRLPQYTSIIDEILHLLNHNSLNINDDDDDDDDDDDEYDDGDNDNDDDGDDDGRDDIRYHNDVNSNANGSSAKEEKDCCYWLKEIRQAKSAQQEVYILSFGCNKSMIRKRRWQQQQRQQQQLVHSNNSNNNNNNNNNRRRRRNNDDEHENKHENNKYEVMESGHNRLVLRIWKGGSRWWNLNRNVDPQIVARAEIMGYQIARSAFQTHQTQTQFQTKHKHNNNTYYDTTIDEKNSNSTRLIMRRKRQVPIIPRVLHFSCSSSSSLSLSLSSSSSSLSTSSSSSLLCWAVLEYVGPDDEGFLHTTASNATTTITPIGKKEEEINDNNNEKGFIDENDDGNEKDDNKIEGQQRLQLLLPLQVQPIMMQVDHSYLNGMINIRNEFGFEEPHPRWGRVPVESCLGYARLVLRDIILPLHCYSSSSSRVILQHDAQTYSTMVRFYRQAWNEVTTKYNDNNNNANSSNKQKYNHDNDVEIVDDKNDNDNNSNGRFRIQQCLKRLEHGLEELEEIIMQTNNNATDKNEKGATVETSRTIIVPPLDPVLVHLDLQPQNMIFYKKSHLVMPSAKQQASVSSSSTRIRTATKIAATDDNRPKVQSEGEKVEQRQQNVNIDGNNNNEEDQSAVTTTDDDDDDNNYNSVQVFSVLDWEDAAWADPRFDLILLCRKVCANREQADIIWSEYAKALVLFNCDKETKAAVMDDNRVVDNGYYYDDFHDSLNNNQGSARNNIECYSIPSLYSSLTTKVENYNYNILGPIQPWLLLETVHSISTMILQSTDLLSGGRNPWETKKDLWDKIQREFSRLDDLLNSR